MSRARTPSGTISKVRRWSITEVGWFVVGCAVAVAVAGIRIGVALTRLLGDLATRLPPVPGRCRSGPVLQRLAGSRGDRGKSGSPTVTRQSGTRQSETSRTDLDHNGETDQAVAAWVARVFHAHRLPGDIP